jgi:hypothetical protein
MAGGEHGMAGAARQREPSCSGVGRRERERRKRPRERMRWGEEKELGFSILRNVGELQQRQGAGSAW